ncbi:hypothetical protein SFRURICE_003459 [Spodoptera frugiperda]|uniref:SFRICE_018440 n=1 Tax=Spodoptera frugiperda TaxID=7108 RepID=A0A2H1W550_SPOFR|nr:hypothetical protein SFRURICE_003459 [Spodoptera frugiperda]
MVSVRKSASYASHVTDFSLSCIETLTTASTDPHCTDRIIGNAYMRCVLMTSYGMRTMRACRRLPLTTVLSHLMERRPLVECYYGLSSRVNDEVNGGPISRKKGSETLIIISAQ